MCYAAQDIGNYFIWRVNSDPYSGDNITHMKLQKLIYYAQGFHLAWYQRPLFCEAIVAWAHGPVVRELYAQFREYGSSPIPTPPDFDPEALDAPTREMLEEVFRVYGQYSAWGLRNLTHDEAPWRDTPVNEVISQRAMQDFFLRELTVA